MISPRIEGQVGVIEDPPEFAGKFAFTIWIDGHEYATHGPYDDRETADKQLRSNINWLYNYHMQVMQTAMIQAPPVEEMH